tara:strand:- start:1465 stop:1776 length:312 start_codon:yes stop_codon:yes gene_type:complete
VETISALLFILISVSLAGAAFALMWKNISDISKISNKIEVESRTVTRPPHPEMREVQPGDELMVVNFKEGDEIDPIYQSLQERIDELTEDDDDDDDGGLVVRT